MADHKSESMDAREADARAANKYRFELELEFVQSLANPHYLQALAQQNIMEDPSFILYLDYLKYWSQPDYARFIMCVKACRPVIMTLVFR
jgi:mediator of RNA polymerase II transcription subunit 31